MTEQPIDLEVAASSFGIQPRVLSLALAHMSRIDDFPYLQFPRSYRPVVIYLDLLHWVALAKAHLGRAETDAAARAYETLIQAASQYRVVVPISAALYMEISRIGSRRQRTDLADTIGMISGFVTLGSASLTTDVQLHNALAKRFGGDEIEVTWPFGIGVGFAFGKKGGIRIRTVNDALALPPPGHLSRDEMILTALGEYMLLRGPTLDEIPDLRALGFKPEAAREIEIDRVRREQYLKDQLEARPDLRRRIGDIVSARHLYWELGDVLPKHLTQYGITTEEFFSYDKDWLTNFLSEVPSAAVNIALREQNFKNTYKSWSGNDIRDFDAMSEAVPYCDIVMTDKHVREQLRKSGVRVREGMLVLSRLSEMIEMLPSAAR